MLNRLETTLVAIALSAITLTSYGQEEAPIRMGISRNPGRSVDFQFEKKEPGTRTLVFKFNDLRNTSIVNEQTVEIRGYAGTALKIKPQDVNQPVLFDSYSYRSLRGRLRPKYKPEFRYILPYSNGKKVTVREAGFVGEKYFGNKTPEDWKSYNFYTQQEDTVIAIRKGLVVAVKDTYDTNNSPNAVFTTLRNSIVVEHEDGTLARYSGFKSGVLVVVGKTVYPGTALGINSKFNRNSSIYNIQINVHYLKSDDTDANKGKNLSNEQTLYGFVTPHFYTPSQPDIILKDKSDYIAGSSAEIVKLEMSKKELKSFK